MGRIEFASCVYLGMLATKSEYQGSGVGPTMMVDAFRKALEAAKHVGIYAITLQAINKRTADKYALDFDFRPFDDGTNITEQSENIWMFLPLETARKAFTLDFGRNLLLSFGFLRLLPNLHILVRLRLHAHESAHKTLGLIQVIRFCHAKSLGLPALARTR
jgi:hypothetical protein